MVSEWVESLQLLLFDHFNCALSSEYECWASKTCSVKPKCSYIYTMKKWEGLERAGRSVNCHDIKCSNGRKSHLCCTIYSVKTCFSV